MYIRTYLVFEPGVCCGAHALRMSQVTVGCTLVCGIIFSCLLLMQWNTLDRTPLGPGKNIPLSAMKHIGLYAMRNRNYIPLSTIFY